MSLQSVPRSKVFLEVKCVSAAVWGSTKTSLKFKCEIQCIGQDISLKNERKTRALSHDLSISAITIKSIRSMFKVLDMYNFECIQTFNQRKNILAPQNMS